MQDRIKLMVKRAEIFRPLSLSTSIREKIMNANKCNQAMWTEFAWTLPVTLVLLGHPLGPVLQNLVSSRPVLGEKHHRKKNSLRNDSPDLVPQSGLISSR